ncbi:tRNA dihydrouridine synthase DusB [Parvimonas micra]|uniref:tRNA dihydrouridine synthase DusB n=1 Tax=Parvimonas micra TaxID=33033 RepID=UPI00123C0083|nr:tRNA dihydrouridine synthase DusB [Parvimonas micra]
MLGGDIFLAPLAGVSDVAFRILASEMGASLTFTEMVSVKGLYYDNENTSIITYIDKREGPVGLQVFGSDENIMAEIIQNRFNKRDDIYQLDLNLGCPAPKIVKNHEGSYLMKDPKKVKTIVSAMVKNSKVPVSVKIRLGFDENNKNFLEVADAIVEAGAYMITLHARTREMFYSGKADWNAIKTLKNHVPIKVVGNGDVCSVEDYVRMKEETGADAVAIGRHALGNPFIFKQIKDYNLTKKYSSPTLEEVIDTIKRHYKLELEFKPERIAIREMRKNILWYLKGFKDSNKVKNIINTLTDIDEIFDVLNEYKNNFN